MSCMVRSTIGRRCDDCEEDDDDAWALPAVGVVGLPPELVEYTEASRLHHRRSNGGGGPTARRQSRKLPT
jgi:hypothetical protein